MHPAPAPPAALTDNAPITLAALAARWLAHHGLAAPAGEGTMVRAAFLPEGFVEEWDVAPPAWDRRATVSSLVTALRKVPGVVATAPREGGLRVTLRFNAFGAAKRMGASPSPELRAGASWLSDTYPTFVAPRAFHRGALSREGYAVLLKLVRGTGGPVGVEALGDALDAAGWRHERVVAAYPADPYRFNRLLFGSTRGRFHARCSALAAAGVTPPLGAPAVAPGTVVAVAPGAYLVTEARVVTDDASAPKGYGLDGYGDEYVIGTVLRAAHAVVLHAPDGTSTTVPGVVDRRTGGVIIDGAALVWLAAAGFGEAAEGVYAALGHHERARLSSPRGRGAECQWCGCDQRLARGTLVDHGYSYPQASGWRGGHLGQRVGSCIGVKALPYEKSCDLLVLARPRLAEVEAATRAALGYACAVVQAGDPLLVPATWVGAADLGPADANGDVRVPHAHPLWGHAADALVGRARIQWERAREALAWCDARIAAWTLRPTYEDRAAAR